MPEETSSKPIHRSIPDLDSPLLLTIPDLESHCGYTVEDLGSRRASPSVICPAEDKRDEILGETLS